MPQNFWKRKPPQELQRLEVSRVFFEAAIVRTRTHVHHFCAERVFNLLEIRISEWVDRVERKVIVPSAMREQKFFMKFTAD
jgi:hypothetical protein